VTRLPATHQNSDIGKISSLLELDPLRIFEQQMQTKIEIKHKFMTNPNLSKTCQKLIRSQI
jgi:hypothetical protein